jgi:hypothetical protein
MDHSIQEWKVMLETQTIDEKTYKRLFDQLSKKYDDICQEILRRNIERSEILDIISIAKNRFKVNYASKQSNIVPEVIKDEKIELVEEHIVDDTTKDTIKEKPKRSKSKKVDQAIEITEDEPEEIQEPIKEKTKRIKSKKM